MKNLVQANTQNWQALLQLRLIATEQRTRMVPQKRYGPLSVQRPFYPEGDVCHVYLLHPPGGVVGGDQLELDIAMEQNAAALVTTPGAAKYYLSAGDEAQVLQSLRIAERARLEYLPQESIFYPGAKVNLATRIDMAQDSHLVYWDKQCYGLPVNGDNFSFGSIVSGLELYRDSRLLFTEKQHIDIEEIGRGCGMRGHPVSATLLVVSERIDSNLLDSLRQIPCADEDLAGLTMPDEGLLMVRYLGGSTLRLNNYFIRLQEALRPVIMQRPVCHPRIWAT